MAPRVQSRNLAETAPFWIPAVGEGRPALQPFCWGVLGQPQDGRSWGNGGLGVVRGRKEKRSKANQQCEQSPESVVFLPCSLILSQAESVTQLTRAIFSPVLMWDVPFFPACFKGKDKWPFAPTSTIQNNNVCLPCCGCKQVFFFLNALGDFQNRLLALFFLSLPTLGTAHPTLL